MNKLVYLFAVFVSVGFFIQSAYGFSLCTDGFFMPQNPGNKTQMTFFYFNDVHGDLKNIGRLKPAHDLYIKKNTGNTSLTVSGGDIYLGNNKARNSVITDIMNTIGLEYTSLGNHEFDANSEQLALTLESADFTSFALNVKIPRENKLSERLKDKKLVRSAIFTKNGTKFAIVGISPSDKDIGSKDKLNKVSSFCLNDTIATLGQEVELLEKNYGVNKIILLSHAGYPADLRIARETAGTDVIIGGHSHTVVNGVKKKSGRCPVNLVFSKRNEPVIITQAGQNNTYVGYLDVLFDESGVLVQNKIKNRLVPLKKFDNSPEIISEIEKVLGKNEEIVKIKTPFVPVNEDEERKGENPVADILADAISQEGKKYGVEAVLFNAPSMKSSKIKDVITTYDIKFRMLPYNDDIFVVTLSEKDFVDLLNIEAQTVATKDNSQMLHCGGMKYTISKNAANKGKLCVSEIYVIRNGSPEKINAVSPATNKTVVCALNTYLFNDERLDFILKKYKTSGIIKIGTQHDIFIKKLRSCHEINAVRDGRITVRE